MNGGILFPTFLIFYKLAGMETILKLLTQVFTKATVEAYPALISQADLFCAEVVQSSHEKFGHYQFNSALKLAKPLKQSPRQIAEEIIKQFQANHQVDEQAYPLFVDQIEIAGPGFINIVLSPVFLEAQLNQMQNEPHFGLAYPVNPRKIIIDFSSPNIAKEMHVGHLRSTIIGDCLARLFEFLGHRVLRLNHIGDWGTAFGMLIHYMKEHVPLVLEGRETTDLSHLVTWYRAAKKAFDEEAHFKKASQLEVVALQTGETAALKAWELICTISRKAYQEIYDLLNIRIEDRGESFYNPFLANIVQALEAKGLIELSAGAKCIYLPGFINREGDPLPLMVQKSDGGYNYATTDMAAIWHRIEIEKGDRLIYVTDAGQTTHFQMIFKAAKQARYLENREVQLDHVTFGLVLGSDGKKFRTRSGETEKLIDLLQTAIQQAEKILTERLPEMNEEERRKIGCTLGLAAVKYADLSCNRIGDYTFSYERMLKFEGNTATFLLYAYVRIAGIKRKVSNELAYSEIVLEHPAEIALGLHLLQFAEALEVVAKELIPHKLTEYLYVLAEKFNAFFRDCRVEGSVQQSSRLSLCKLTGRVLKQGLALLGISTVDRM